MSKEQFATSREIMHDLAMCLPSLHDLRVMVLLPQDSSTHIENLEKAYADARSIIIGLLDASAVSETVPKLSEMTVPLLDAMSEPCKGCGQRPVDFISGGASTPSATRDSILEEAAEECLKLWRGAPNDRERGFLQTQISHGCIASAVAIRDLKRKL